MPEPSESEGLPGDEPKPFLQHLEELRWTLIRCLIALGVGLLLCTGFVPWIIAFLKRPLEIVDPEGVIPIFSWSPTGVVGVWLRVGAWSGLLITLPFVIYFITRFVFPGLTRREKQVIGRASGFSAGLFLFGVFLGYFVCEYALRMLLTIHGWINVAPQWTIQYYVIFVIQLMIGFGLAFQMPVIVLILGKLGLITHHQLRGKRRHVLVGCFVVGMFLTPAEVVSQVVMAVPLYFLYEMCIWILWLDDRKRAKEGAGSERGDTP